MKSLSFWTNLSSNNSQSYPPRWGHSITKLSKYAYIFGGYSHKYRKDIYKFHTDAPFSLEKLHPKNKIPFTRRSHHSAIPYKDQIIFFGGMTDLSKEIEYENDSFSEEEIVNLIYEPFYYDIQNNEIKVMHTINNPKELRTYHTSNLVLRKYMFVYGGEAFSIYGQATSNNNANLKPYLLDLDSKKWFNVLFRNNNNNNRKDIYNRKFHCSCTSPTQDKVYIYGGYSEEFKCLNNLIVFYFNENDILSSINSNSNDFFNEIIIPYKYISFDGEYAHNNIIPFPRWGATLTYHNSNTLFLFGGRNKEDFNDLWIFNIEKEQWRKIYFYNEFPIPRRKHISLLFNNTLFISGGYNGSFLNDCYCTNLNFIKDFNEKEQEIFLLINNPKYSDMTFEYSYNDEIITIPCIKSFFFSRIPHEDLLFSNTLLDLIKEQKDSTLFLKETSYSKHTKHSIIALISLLYMGYFPYNNITKKILLEIFHILYFSLKMLKTMQILFTCIIKNTKESIEELSSFIHRNHLTSNLLDYDLISNIISSSFTNDEYIISFNKYTSINPILCLNNNHLPLKSKNHLIYTNSIYLHLENKLLQIIPEYIKNIFNIFSNKGVLHVVTVPIYDIIELLFYADYCCYTLLYNNIELRIINNIRNTNTFSLKFMVCLLIFAYFTNSQILFVFVLNKIKSDFDISLRKICKVIKRMLVFQNDCIEICKYIAKIGNENCNYFSFTQMECCKVGNGIVRNFGNVLNRNMFPEKRAIEELMNKLYKANLFYKLPKLNLKLNMK